MNRAPLHVVAACAIVVSLPGCRTAAPIHVWQPPELASTVGHRVVVSRVSGPQHLADPVYQTLIETVPHDVGRRMELVGADALQAKTQIQLVSHTDDQPNDLALVSVARREGFDFMLRGEIIQRRGGSGFLDETTPLRISWRLISLADNRSEGGQPVTVDLATSIDRYPDLGFVQDPQNVLTRAAARDAQRLFMPWIDRQWVKLAIPYLTPGSREVRRGNAAALSGRWEEAEQIWAEVIEAHPRQVAAHHNLALAAAAEQDFSRAKKLAREAIRLQRGKLSQETLVWIELQQRRYHEAFNLDDPPEGWFVSRNPNRKRRASNTESAAQEPSGTLVFDERMIDQ